jgi:hypothetical protein
MNEYPITQAKDLFPALIAYHVIMTSGSGETDPKLHWAVDYYWRYMTTSNTSRDEMNDKMISMILIFYQVYVIKLATRKLSQNMQQLS